MTTVKGIDITEDEAQGFLFKGKIIYLEEGKLG